MDRFRKTQHPYPIYLLMLIGLLWLLLIGTSSLSIQTSSGWKFYCITLDFFISSLINGHVFHIAHGDWLEVILLLDLPLLDIVVILFKILKDVIALRFASAVSKADTMMIVIVIVNGMVVEMMMLMFHQSRFGLLE